VRDPIRTIKRAAPFAMLLIAVAYVAVNVAYFAVVSKQDILGGGTLAAYGRFLTQLCIRTQGIFAEAYFSGTSSVLPQNE